MYPEEIKMNQMEQVSPSDYVGFIFQSEILPFIHNV